MSKRKYAKTCTDNAEHLSKLGYVGKAIRHKATGVIGVLDWYGKDFNDSLGIQSSDGWIGINYESEFELLEPEDAEVYHYEDES